MRCALPLRPLGIGLPELAEHMDRFELLVQLQIFSAQRDSAPWQPPPRIPAIASRSTSVWSSRWRK